MLVVLDVRNIIDEINHSGEQTVDEKRLHALQEELRVGEMTGEYQTRKCDEVFRPLVGAHR
jgi:hypothetical protein